IRTIANSLELPLIVNGNRCVHDEYIAIICQSANERFANNRSRCQAFEDSLSQLQQTQALTSSGQALRDSLQQPSPSQAISSLCLMWDRLDLGEVSATALHRWGHSASVVDNKFYVFGGYGLGSTGGCSHRRLNDLLCCEYHSDSKSFSMELIA